MSYPKIIHAHADACTGCKICEMVCSLVHETNGINPKSSRIRILENTEKGVFVPVVCQLCSNTPCIEVCPESALTRDKKTGAVLVEEELCNACGLCIDACDNNAIFIHPEKEVAYVCDLCGGEPKCVEYCLQDALLFEPGEECGKGQKSKTIKKEV